MWNQTILYRFPLHDDPIYPNLLGFNTSGALIGVTSQGGDGASCSYCGSIFKLNPSDDGSWKENDLFNFNGFSDGADLTSAVLTSSGKVFGAAADAGRGRAFGGEIFSYDPGSRDFGILYSFPSTDGQYPYAGLTADGAGNFYGTTVNGGSNNIGSIFEISPVGTGWKEKVIHSFGPERLGLYFSVNPSELTLDAQGNL